MTRYALQVHARSLDHRVAAVEWNLRRARQDPSTFNLSAVRFHAEALRDTAERALSEARS